MRPTAAPISPSGPSGRGSSSGSSIPATGKLISDDTPVFALAGRQGGAIEAPSILEHEGKFYLFVSFDQCCKGVASTYNIRVGRADRIEGPYLDRDGKDMLEGGGSLVLATTGRFIGPGGQEAVKTSQGRDARLSLLRRRRTAASRNSSFAASLDAGRLAGTRPVANVGERRRRRSDLESGQAPFTVMVRASSRLDSGHEALLREHGVGESIKRMRRFSWSSRAVFEPSARRGWRGIGSSGYGRPA